MKIFRLPNGITCVSEERPGNGTVSMQIHIKSGIAHESMEESGLTFLTQESCNGGTLTKTREQIADSIESRGGTLSTVTGRETTIFSASSLTRYTDDIFSVLADMVRHPAFEDAEIEQTKKQIQQLISEEAEAASSKAKTHFFEEAFAGQPIGLNPMGTPEMAASFTPAQVKQKYNEMLAHPENIVISFTGDIDAAHAEKLVQDHFSDLPAAASPAVVPQMSFTEGDYRECADNEQLNLAFGFKAPSRQGADKYAFVMFDKFLCGGMSSPLFCEIREKRGLVYGIRTAYTRFETAGLFYIFASSSKGNAGELMSSTFDLLGGIIRDGVDQKKLDQTRESILRGLKGKLEKTSNSGAKNAEEILFGGRVISLEEIEENLKQVTSDDIRRICAEMLRDGKYALSAVGPQDTMPTPHEIKEMMQAQVKGVAVPVPRPVQPSIKRQLAQAVKKEDAGSTDPKMTVLPNGMKVVTVERPGNLSCGAWVGAGSDHETPELNGATHMNEHMMFKGTPSYGPGEIDKVVEGELGAGLNAYTNRDKTAYYFYNLKADNLEKVVDICGEMVFQANLDHAEFDGKDGRNGERDVVIEEIKMYKDEADSVGMDLLQKIAYPGQPHGRPILGTEETIGAMTVEQLASYRDEFYAPNNVVFCMAGPVSHEDFVALIEKKFGHLAAKEFPPLPAVSYQGGTASVEMDTINLCNISLAAKGVSDADPDILPYQILSIVLGYGTSSRLYKEVVLKQNLAGGVIAANDTYITGGTFDIVATLPADKIKPFLKSVYGEIRSLAENMTQAELDKAKALLEKGWLKNLETNGDVCDHYACNTQAYGRPITPAERSGQLQKVTLEDIKRITQAILSSNPALAMVVPKGTDPKYLPRHAEVVDWRDGKTAPPEPGMTNDKPPSP